MRTSNTETDQKRLGGSYFKLLSASTISNLGDGIAVVAYPWLASAITRNPLLISLVIVVQRLPWLLFTLPAGVITDRHDRRHLMVISNAARVALTVVVAFAVLGKQGNLPGPDAVADAATIINTDLVLYLLVLLATFLLGIAEVLYDNSAQTFMPSIVEADNLERANGRLWSTELVANTMVGPPLGALLVAVAFSLPFFVDAATFAVSAALVLWIAPASRPAADPPEQQPTEPPSWRADLAEGVRWLWGHELLRPMAIILGVMNMLFVLSASTLVLFSQEVLDTTATEFAILGTGGAVGGVVGGWTASNISQRIGPGPSLWLTLLGGGLSLFITGLLSWWPAVWLLFGFSMLVGTLWNVITVSLRQTIIPDRLLGRVNSVYRFFAWGMMPVGAILGGAVVAITDTFTTREFALRMPWFVAGTLHLVLFAFAAPRLTTAKIESARLEAPSASLAKS